MYTSCVYDISMIRCFYHKAETVIFYYSSKTEPPPSHLHIAVRTLFLTSKVSKGMDRQKRPYHLATLFSWMLFYVPPFLSNSPELAGGTGSVAATGTDYAYKCVDRSPLRMWQATRVDLNEHLWTVHTVGHKNFITPVFRAKICLDLIAVPPTCSAISHITSHVNAGHLELPGFLTVYTVRCRFATGSE
jgi:hypothetical protein